MNTKTIAAALTVAFAAAFGIAGAVEIESSNPVTPAVACQSATQASGWMVTSQGKTFVCTTNGSPVQIG